MGFGDRKIDPFVKCIPMWNDKCSKEKKDQWKATNYVDDAGVNPVFDEIKHEAKLSFAIPEKLSKPATFYIEVHDYDSFTGSDFIGSAEIDLTKLIFGKSKTNETPVALKRTKRKKQISAGTLFVKFTHVLPPPPEPRKKPVPKASKKKKNKNKE